MIVNTQKSEAVELAENLLRWGRSEGVHLHLPSHEAHVLGEPDFNDREWKETVDMAIVLGGDGTFLRAARYVTGYPIPLYGINVGHLGFLSCGNVRKAEQDITRILKGEHTVQKRSLLRGVVTRGDRRKHELYALNDLVISKGPFARVISIEITIGDKPLNILHADGILLSTPTGSTAYALSAGGPIVPPHVPCMILVPICAHTLYSRPMILGEEDVVTLSPQGQHREIMLTQDGQLGYELLPGDHIHVSLSRDKFVEVITLPENEYYSLLKEKFRWGHSKREEGGD